MNERIKELAKEAEQQYGGIHVVDIEKFAELIVRKCADIATIHQYEAYSVGHYVLKHFGIEGVSNEDGKAGLLRS